MINNYVWYHFRRVDQTHNSVTVQIFVSKRCDSDPRIVQLLDCCLAVTIISSVASFSFAKVNCVAVIACTERNNANETF